MSHTCSISSPLTTNNIDGVGIWEWVGSYQNLQKTFNTAFYNKLVNWKRNVEFYNVNYGSGTNLYSIGHLGVYACKHISGTNTPSYHSYARAFDLAFLRWGTATGPSLDIRNGAHASSSQATRRLYLGVNAVCLKYFSIALNGWTPDHANHIHVDDSSSNFLLNTGSAWKVRFVQAVCNNFNGTSLAIDGLWGSQTATAYNNANDVMCFSGNPMTSSSKWLDWCSMIAKHGFKNVTLGTYKYGPCL